MKEHQFQSSLFNQQVLAKLKKNCSKMTKNVNENNGIRSTFLKSLKIHNSL